MSDIESLNQRIDAEFASHESRLESFREEQLREYEGRHERLERLEAIFRELRGVWAPRLEALAAKFGDKVKVTPRVTPSSRQGIFEFQSQLAKIELRFGATTDADVRHVILTYDLDILPILMRFESHSEIEFAIDSIDLAAAGKWMDDRILGFVKTYLSLHENELYLKGLMVDDPIAGVRFPKFAAACSLNHGGTTYYFIGEETRGEFAKQKGISV
jgi:YHS domain-containing protein